MLIICVLRSFTRSLFGPHKHDFFSNVATTDNLHLAAAAVEEQWIILYASFFYSRSAWFAKECATTHFSKALFPWLRFYWHYKMFSFSIILLCLRYNWWSNRFFQCSFHKKKNYNTVYFSCCCCSTADNWNDFLRIDFFCLVVAMPRRNSAIFLWLDYNLNVYILDIYFKKYFLFYSISWDINFLHISHIKWIMSLWIVSKTVYSYALVRIS